MLNLAIAALFLIGTHFGIASTSLRRQLIGLIGEGPYRALYSLLALVALAWLVFAWAAAPIVPLWASGAGLRHLVATLMPLAFLLFTCAVTAPNPTVIGQRPDPDASEPATGIVRVTRHPFMWGVGIWALLHLAANGDQASLIFFGSLALLALGDSPHRPAADAGEPSGLGCFPAGYLKPAIRRHPRAAAEAGPRRDRALAYSPGAGAVRRRVLAAPDAVWGSTSRLRCPQASVSFRRSRMRRTACQSRTKATLPMIDMTEIAGTIGA